VSFYRFEKNRICGTNKTGKRIINITIDNLPSTEGKGLRILEKTPKVDTKKLRTSQPCCKP